MAEIIIVNQSRWHAAWACLPTEEINKYKQKIYPTFSKALKSLDTSVIAQINILGSVTYDPSTFGQSHTLPTVANGRLCLGLQTNTNKMISAWTTVPFRSIRQALWPMTGCQNTRDIWFFFSRYWRFRARGLRKEEACHQPLCKFLEALQPRWLEGWH